MRIFSKYQDKGFWWFRIFGWGLHGKNIKLHPMLFSERNRKVKFIKIGNWIFKILKP